MTFVELSRNTEFNERPAPMATTDEISAAPPCIAERYAGAVSTSSLLAPEEYRPTDAYVLVASGLGRKDIGGWLMRLQTEWARTARPQRTRPMTVGQYAAKLPPVVTGKEKVKIKVENEDGSESFREVERSVRGPDLERAKRMHAEAVKAIPRWYDAEIRMLKNRMRDMPQVRDHLCVWLCAPVWEKLKFGPPRRQQFRVLLEAEQLVAEVLLYWLDDTCADCNGERWLTVQGTNRLSNRKCPECHGSGKKDEPEGQGQLMLDYMRQCIFDWRQSTSAQMQTMSGRQRAPRALRPKKE